MAIEMRDRLTVGEATVSRAEVEDFLYYEADLLDEWRLDEWFSLFTEDGAYEVPATDVRGGERTDTLFIIADDIVQLRGRVNRLKSKNAFAESPHSRTRRLINNVRLLGAEGGDLFVSANFVVYRLKHQAVDLYIGKYLYTLRPADGAFKIRRRRVVLDLETLRPAGGKVSMIL